MKLEIKCYKVLSLTGNGTARLQQTGENKIYDIRCIEELGCLYILLSGSRREKIFRKYNNIYPVSQFTTDGIPMVNTSTGKEDVKVCMLEEIKPITSINEVQEFDYIFSVNH